MSESFNYTETTAYKIESCIDCPFHEVVPDPDPYDSFNMDDEAVICKKSNKKPNTNGISYFGGEPVCTCACRPYQVRAETTPPPSWCPIRPVISKTVENEKSKNQPIYDYILSL